MSSLSERPRPHWASFWGEDRYGAFAGFHVGDVAARLRWIPPGTFTMGSPDDEPEREDDEGPQREVILTEGFWLGEFPCTQALWTAVMGNNPSQFQHPDRPVERVSWDDVQTFLERIEERLPGLNLCLPSEAQWEYACRAGTETATYGELDEIAWYDQNSGGETHVVGEKRPNAWGLYDTLGNVWEWCLDVWRGAHGDVYRISRGGLWGYGARYARAAYRDLVVPSDHWYGRGFRFCRSPGRGQAPRDHLG